MITWIEIVSWTVLLSSLVLSLVILIATVRDQIVMYLDKKDFWLSFSPWLVLFFGLSSLVSMQEPGSEVNYQNLSMVQQSVWYIEWIVIIFLCTATTYLSIKYNRSVIIGIVVSFYKIILSLVVVIGVLGQLSIIFNRKSSLLQQSKAALIFALLSTIRDELINGKQVYAEKSWKFPQPIKITLNKLE
ncbi:hypothetical protein D8Y20_02615 [Mariprofundus sp. EBB-1]|uniref:hypothetical protein n=1 Tax=Mariprofundus sp. EBB-1 TaxID=2650971 RepID=UPI000EF17C86|nr:hypothetical protein [Mariprofundus sp. EBB-1]RLL54695.1 hypothetical protein D8Y20_02615 [Mariprofundus sp. EBB-1]